MNADVAFLTTGSIRGDISGGFITWGDLYRVQPFSNTLFSMTLSGRQIRRALEQQGEDPLPPHNLGVSGLTYTYSPSRPAGNRVVDVMVGGMPLDDSANYTVAMVSFLAEGGDCYTVFREGTSLTAGPVDIDALAEYIGSLPQPVDVTIDGRIRRVP